MRALVPMLVVLALAAPAVGAGHCESWRDSESDVTLPVDQETAIYVALDCTIPGGIIIRCGGWLTFPLWIYEESNGIPGLQRGDEFVDDTCHRMIEPDTVVF